MNFCRLTSSATGDYWLAFFYSKSRDSICVRMYRSSVFSGSIHKTKTTTASECTLFVSWFARCIRQIWLWRLNVVFVMVEKRQYHQRILLLLWLLVIFTSEAQSGCSEWMADGDDKSTTLWSSSQQFRGMIHAKRWLSLYDWRIWVNKWLGLIIIICGLQHVNF